MIALALLLPGAACFLVSPTASLRNERLAAPLMRASLAELEQREQRGEIVAGVGEGRELPSLSGINTAPVPVQVRD